HSVSRVRDHAMNLGVGDRLSENRGGAQQDQHDPYDDVEAFHSLSPYLIKMNRKMPVVLLPAMHYTSNRLLVGSAANPASCLFSLKYPFVYIDKSSWGTC